MLKPLTSAAALSDVLTEAERNPKWLTANSTLVEAVEAFQSDTDLRLLPILDHHGCPVGAIFEKDVRRLLLNPFGHALLRNPTYGGMLSGHIRPCPTIELTDDVGALVEHYRRSDGREGMILTVGGRIFATLTNRRLLMLAAEHEHRATRARLERAQRIEHSAAKFEAHAAALSAQMVQLANSVQRLAEATVDRATIAGKQASSIGASAVQTRDSLAHIAARGEGLARSFLAIEESLRSNRSVSETTVERVAKGGQQARLLLEAAGSIDGVMAQIADIAGTVNLLSLNAAIEAVRAGDAGRGFGVVAGEIRSLSEQTHQAIQAITEQVHALKTGIALVAEDYGQIEESIGSMAAGTAEIDRAITGESETTRLIARTVAEASDASVTVEGAISTIVQSVRSASSSAHELDRMANDLRRGATGLGDSVGQFLADVRAA